METTTKEQVVATINTEQVLNEQEAQQTADNVALQVKVSSMVIQTEDQYKEAAEIGKDIKRRAKMVQDLFAPIKAAAHEAHRVACDRERAMLSPLQDAEKRIKGLMSAYTAEQERKRREAEEAARRAREEAARKALEEAVALEQQGKQEQADAALEEADIMAATPVAVAQPVTPTKGVTTKKVWEVQIVDPSAVPISVAGIVIRPVDEMAIKKLANTSKGQISIPGVRIVEKVQTILRT